MLCDYSHTNSQSLAQIRATFAKIQNFLQGITFTDAPCIPHIHAYT